ncbi:MAG: Wzt carbohydrate-binding domain-containing protein, partial [Gammaproteobacteria bacterium]|nr:Wzt carbohydrate-binding domain-containing protein [Gammaproteobacteria bacterium]
GVEKYIDTPVKRYSSGMTVRLAFSVAAHLEPEILVIDEVLAVGDADFQKKCVGKMNEVADGGRTILFVSHNLKLVESLCSRTLVLYDGCIAYCGDTRDSLQFYKSEIGEALPAIVIRNAGIVDFVKIINIESLQDVISNQDFTLELLFRTHQSNISFYCDIGVTNTDDVKIIHSRSTWRYDSPFKLQHSGDFKLSYSLKNLNLAPGRYFIEVYIYSGPHVFYYAKNIEAFKISSKNFHGGSLSMDHVNAFTVPEFELKLNK